MKSKKWSEKIIVKASKQSKQVKQQKNEENYKFKKKSKLFQ